MAASRITFQAGPRASHIVLDRPPLNIIDLEMMAELEAAWTEAEALGSTVVTITGRGGRAFSAGVEIRDHFAENVQEMLERFHRLIRRIRQSPVVSIAAAHGATLGGGAELAMSCDLVIVSDDLRFGFPEIQLACFPPVAAAALPRSAGRRFSSEMVLLGTIISGTEAQQRGLVNAVVPASELEGAVTKYVDRLLSLSAPVVRLAKRALIAGEDFAFEAALSKCEAIYRDDLLSVADMNEGLQAFLQKRAPDWRHK